MSCVIRVYKVEFSKSKTKDGTPLNIILIRVQKVRLLPLLSIVNDSWIRSGLQKVHEMETTKEVTSVVRILQPVKETGNWEIQKSNCQMRSSGWNFSKTLQSFILG